MHKKINIVDVLKVSPDSKVDKVDQKETESTDDLSSNDDDDDDFFDESDDKIDENDDKVDEKVTNFIESVEFCQLRKRFNYPNSISEVLIIITK